MESFISEVCRISSYLPDFLSTIRGRPWFKLTFYFQNTYSSTHCFWHPTPCFLKFNSLKGKHLTRKEHLYVKKRFPSSARGLSMVGSIFEKPRVQILSASLTSVTKVYLSVIPHSILINSLLPVNSANTLILFKKFKLSLWETLIPCLSIICHFDSKHHLYSYDRFLRKTVHPIPRMNYTEPCLRLWQ